MMGYIFSMRKKTSECIYRWCYVSLTVAQTTGVSREHLGGHIRPARNGSSLTPAITRAYELSTGKQLPTFQTVFMPSTSRTLEVGKRMYTKIVIIIGIQPLGRSGQRPEFSQATGMALVRCILGKFLGVFLILDFRRVLNIVNFL